MAGLGSTFANDLAKLLLNATAIALIADNAATTPLTSLYVSLHLADPVAGDQSTSEVSYTGYARVAVVRTAGGFSVTGRVGSLVANAAFPADTAGTQGTVTHFAIGTLASGTGKIIGCGTFTPNAVLAVGPGPIVASGSTFTLN